jgi:hypothetical protein
MSPSTRALAGAFLKVAALPFMLWVAGCHSYRIDATVQNHTGEAITELEVDYPSASFGTNRVAADGVFRYRFQVRNSGPVTVQYNTANDHQVKVSGPSLFEQQEGRIDIVLQPAGKVEFHPALTPDHP